jgi:OOP family OmpA-OmpF porin
MRLIGRVAAAARLAGLAAWTAALPAAALEPELPGGAVQTAAESAARGSDLLATGAWDGTRVPLTAVEGAVRRTAWRVPVAGITTLELLAPLRQQALAAGYRIVFECETAACGGFDFRYALPLVPEPDMHVDLGDFRYLAATRGASEALSVIVSRSAAAGFVQLTVVTPAAAAAAAPEAAAAAEPGPPPGLLDKTYPENGAPAGGALDLRLAADGRAVLDDLIFAPGSSALADAEFASLAALAAWLAADPARRVAIVGHTDTAGGLEANIALSRQRAAAVRDRLLDAPGVAPAQLTAEGVGFLAPRASNATETGRALNRRVEVVVIDPGAAAP